jgi:hypothetical protein
LAVADVALGYNPGTSYRAWGAFAALTHEGSVVPWGYGYTENLQDFVSYSSVSDSLTRDVSAIYSTGNAFAALKTDGSVVTWGDGGTSSDSGGGNSSSVSGSLTSGVSVISSTSGAFAALKIDGSVVVWGSSESDVDDDMGANYGEFGSTEYGGNSSAVSAHLTSGVSVVYSTSRAFAALKSDGSVVTWGNSEYGGNITFIGSSIASGVSVIYSTDRAFAALKSDGSLVTWGGWGGDSSSVSGSLTSGVSVVFSTRGAFAALKTDGSVIVWGNSEYGADSSSVSGDLTSGVSAIYSTERAFAALKSDGSVVTWGDSEYGGDTSVGSGGDLTSGVSSIYSTSRAFAALKSDGSVTTWGNSDNGYYGDEYGADSSSVSEYLTSGVSAIYSTGRAFAALKSDGSVVTWGDGQYTGSSISLSGSLSSGVSAIYSNAAVFAALKSDGSVVVWGDSSSGGDSSYVHGLLQNVAKVFGGTIYAGLSTTMHTYTVDGCASGSATHSLGVDGTWTIQSSCTTCAVGTYDSLQSCIPCAEGTYTTTTGSTSCTVCDAGKTSSNSRDSCPESCSAGEGSVSGDGGCFACSAGRYSAEAGSSSCTAVEAHPDYITGSYSSDKVTVEQCGVDSEIVLTGAPPIIEYDYVLEGYVYVFIEDSQGSSKQVCSPCRSFYTSYCEIAESVSFEDYRNSVISYLKCSQACKLFSLNLSRGVVWGGCSVLIALFVAGFFFLDRKQLDDENENEDEDEEGSSGKSKSESKSKGKSLLDLSSYPWGPALELFMFVVIPVTDTATDLAYLLTTQFYLNYFFYAALLAFLIPNFAFCWLLYKREVLFKAHMYMPCFDKLPMNDVVNDNLANATWSVFIRIPYAILNLPFLAPKLVLGMLLNSTKVFAIGGVYNRWMQLWTASEKHGTASFIDAEVLNESVYMEILGETFPQVIIQVWNNYAINPNILGWGTVNILSLAVTVINTFNGLWKIGYYKLYRGISLVDIPISMSTLKKDKDKGEKMREKEKGSHMLVDTAGGVDEEAGGGGGGGGDDNKATRSLTQRIATRVGDLEAATAASSSSVELVDTKERGRVDAALARALAERDAALMERDAALADAAATKKLVAERDGELAEKDSTIAELRQKIKEFSSK